MSWRTVVIANTSKLDYNMGYLVVRSVEKTIKIHLSEIAVVIIENTSSSVSCGLLSKFTQEKIKVIFCDEKRNPSSELTPYYGSHDCSLKLKKQMQWESVAKQQAWTHIVAEKIKNQSALLKAAGKDEYKKLDLYIDELEFYDETNREGQAAKVYFNALFGKSFSRQEDNCINASLNYGYSLILSAFNREVVCNGYLTQLGIFHDNMFNQYNLSCDLMEPFRPIVDWTVYRMQPKAFERNEKNNLAFLLYDEFAINGRKNTLLNAIKIYSKSVFTAIEKNDVSLIKYPNFYYEL